MKENNKRVIKNKRMKRIVLILPVIVFAVSFMLARQAPVSDIYPKTSDNSYNQDVSGYVVSTNPYSAYLAAHHARTQRSYSDVAHFMQQVLVHDEVGGGIKREAVQQYIIAGKVQEAIALAGLERSEKKSTESDPLYTLLFIVDDIKTGRYDDALLEIDQFKGKGLLGAIQPLIENWLRLGNNGSPDYKRLALSIENAGFFSSLMQYQVALMAAQTDDIQRATELFKQSTASMSSTPLRMVLQALTFFKQTNNEKAFSDLKRAYEDQYSYSQILNYFSASSYARVASAEAGLAELFFMIANLLASDQLSAESLLYLELATYLAPHFSEATLLKAHLLEVVKQYGKAAKLYEEIADNDIYYPRAQVQKALNYEALGEIKKALRILSDAEKRYPQYYEIMRSRADIYRANKQYIKAANVYSDVIEAYDAVALDADWRLYYARGISYERAKQWDIAEKDLLKALALKPKQADVLNYLGYSWVDRGEHIVRAKDYIREAIKQRPQDAHIIDSMGWVYYRLGEFDNAIKYLEHAITLLPQDPILNDHLGDAYFRVGREKEATFQWNRALDFSPELALKQQIEQKLDAGLPEFTPLIINTTGATEPLAALE